jgi:hypothetical protein
LMGAVCAAATPVSSRGIAAASTCFIDGSLESTESINWIVAGRRP